MTALTVRPVQSAADHRAFFEFPWVLYKDDPNWVPPLLSMRRELLDRQHAPAWDYLRGEFFGAWRGDRLVGTVSGFINPRHNEFHGENIGWFGAFDCEDDQAAATALLTAAADWVRGHGVTALRGPQTFTTHEECGLLVDGFAPPVILYPYNKPYYARLIEGAGLHRVMDTHGFVISAADARAHIESRFRRVAEGLMKRGSITIRPVDKHNLKRDFGLFKELYNSAWEKNWGFVPMTPRELDGLVESLGQFFDPQMAFFAYVADELAGFIIAIPDFNEVLIKARARPGVPEILTLLQALYHWKLKPSITGIRIPLMGVKAEFRNRGVDVIMYYHALQAILERGYDRGDAGWILATNQPMMSVLNNVGAKIYRTYRFYEQAL